MIHSGTLSRMNTLRRVLLVAAVVCFAKDGGERLRERGAELFVVGDVQARVERLVRNPAVGVAGELVCVVRVGQQS